ncbi:OmpH family outer membrane protein [Cytophagales bacterium LB-30]|uniref:OmpH family outer membrane protein n=1 Tax=Shiella aurantiaca TaxID=3058365 RepID=A0ABT8F4Q8_9BACT|nr:OmpH family outer membrane protein [Shiella aurantiaca]MDN4165349.1 OmpH family outer membrane protein [Shiella aurantiaca]
MKNISTVLNAVLLVAVAVLYYLHFSSAKPSEVETNASAKASDLAIAYINSDSLLSKYDFFKQISEQLEAKRTKLEAEYTNRAQGLQTEIENFQRNANTMTIGQAKAVEEDLMKKQQNLMRYQESLGQELMAEEAKLQNELYDKVAEYLAEYGKANNLQLVLTYSKGSGVIFANDSLNITNEVLKGLNESFATTPASTEK